MGWGPLGAGGVCVSFVCRCLVWWLVGGLGGPVFSWVSWLLVRAAVCVCAALLAVLSGASCVTWLERLSVAVCLSRLRVDGAPAIGWPEGHDRAHRQTRHTLALASSGTSC